MTGDLHVVILAAGKGTRMKSVQPKVLHPLAGRPLIEHVLRTVDELSAASTILVVGHGAEEVTAALSSRPTLQFVVQSPQLGTGHALLQTRDALAGKTGTVLLLYADVPLLQSGTLARLIEAHQSARAAATVLTAELDDPCGYGRIVRDRSGKIVRIVEERDASGEERAIREINSGIYAFALSPLFAALDGLAADNAQSEYYLTDLVSIYRRKNQRVETLLIEAPDELRGVNSRVDLADLGRVLRARKNRALMLDGVTLDDPSTTYVDDDVEVGSDTVIGPGVLLEGRTRIGQGCRIGAGAHLTNAILADNVTVRDRSVIVDSTVEPGAVIGPFAHIRPQSIVGENAHVGNFVELKKTRLGRGSKANHLAYLGDATIGDAVNIGAGTITCNYDGVKKHPTVIEDDVFIGSDSQLIAPVRVGRGAYVAAGSSITDDVPPDSLAIARGRQENKPGWAEKRRVRRTQGGV
ncbi:MAG TPA: bifunctional UDP-N-acetylglucosamine diphosphorylase/glucosamine-1-phosphate N-acetyltransferase GlmU [Vicinamibacterales bacterium]|nr:bifunctional UDP-N-acetylglucosamine diphosphorylase/glucosamine-1-phosphate N-acetyltransferase GlmU [Vicinamibacterales bacterium]